MPFKHYIVFYFLLFSTGCNYFFDSYLRDKTSAASVREMTVVVEALSASALKVSWTEVDFADSYRLFYRSTGQRPSSCSDGLSVSVDTSELSVVVKNLSSLITYEFLVCPIYNGQVFGSASSSPKKPDFCVDRQTTTEPFANSDALPLGTPADPYLICTAKQFSRINSSSELLASHFMLGQNIDLSALGGPTEPMAKSTAFTGSIDGQNFELSNFTFNDTIGEVVPIGLFSQLGSGSKILNLRIKNFSIYSIGAVSVGALVGYTTSATIENIVADQISVETTLATQTGGLVGYSLSGTFKNVLLSHLTVQGQNYIGGLAGRFQNSTVKAVSVDATLSGLSDIGGLSGAFDNSKGVGIAIKGVLTGSERVGSLTGGISMSFLGWVYSLASINSTVNTLGHVGPLVGVNSGNSTVKDAYFAGQVSVTNGISASNGCDSKNSPASQNCFWDNEKPGLGIIGGSTYSLSTLATQDKTSYYTVTGATGVNVPFDFFGASDGPREVWTISPGQTPKLWFEEAIDPQADLLATGDGSIANPYLISTAAQLVGLSENPRFFNVNIRILNDIDLSFYDGSTAAKLVYPIAKSSCFSGTFDGGYFRIRNLTMNFTTFTILGFINSLCVGSVVKNVVLENVSIDASAAVGIPGGVGALVGYNDGLIINSGVASGSVTGVGTIGGLAGRSWGYISNSFSKANVTSLGGFPYVGGLVGDGRGGVFRSYTWGNVSTPGAAQYVAGITGIGKVVVGYAYGAVPAAGANRGAISGGTTSYHVFYNSSAATPPASNGASYLIAGDFLTLAPFQGDDWPIDLVPNAVGNAYWVIRDGLPPRLWWEVDSTIRPESDILRGLGNEDSPYLIETAEQLLHFDQSLMAGYNYFALTSNLDLQGHRLISLGISSLNSDVTVYFDGRGYTISNYIQDKGYAGLFGSLEFGSIKRLKLIDVVVTNAQGTAGILAPSLEDMNLEKIYVAGSITSIGTRVGAVSGSLSGQFTVKEVAANADIAGTDYLGGLFGTTTFADFLTHSIQDCSFTGQITDTVPGGNYVGGLIGRVNSQTTLSKCFSGATFVTATAGGIVGSVNAANLTASNNYFDAVIDGIAGTSAGSSAFSDSTNAANRGLGLATASTYLELNFLSWDFTTVWTINSGVSTPTLRWQDDPPITVP